MTLAALAVSLSAALAMVSCSGGDDPAPGTGPVAVTGVSLPPALALRVGDSHTLQATVQPPGADNKAVSWSTGAPGVATVENGLVTALGNGGAAITATTIDGGKTATCAVTVTTPVAGVTMSQPALTLVVGGTSGQLTATVQPSDASNKDVAWTSSSPAVAAVVGDGPIAVVTAGNINGEATITATTADGAKEATCIVTVVTPATGVSLDRDELTLSVGRSHALAATVEPATASDKAVAWSSSAPGVAAVSDAGLVTALRLGDATITATAADGGFEAACAVSVEPPYIPTLHTTWDSKFDSSLAIMGDGSLWAWGGDYFGLLGVGGPGGVGTPVRVPTRVGAASDWAFAAVGAGNSAAIKADGGLWMCGMGYYGTLGNGSTAERNTHAQVGEENSWASVRIGGYSVLAIKKDGSLWAWGGNGIGQLGLGDGAADRVFTPARVGGDDDWAVVDYGGHAMAIKKDGSLWTWGSNDDGQLGLGDTATRTAPVRVGGDDDWAAVSVGYSHTLAIKKDGSLWAWGDHTYGQLGLGPNPPEDRSVPNRVGSANDWATLAAYRFHSLAIRKDGSLWAWGNYGNGQLGLPGPSRNVPTQVGVDNDWVAVKTGTAHTLALKADGSLWATGWNLYGQFGNDTDYTENRYGLMQVGEGFPVPEE